jgi:hypothetical protein
MSVSDVQCLLPYYIIEIIDSETLTDDEVLDVIDIILKSETVFLSTYFPILYSWVLEDNIIDEYEKCEILLLICTYYMMPLELIILSI